MQKKAATTCLKRANAVAHGYALSHRGQRTDDNGSRARRRRRTRHRGCCLASRCRLLRRLLLALRFLALVSSLGHVLIPLRYAAENPYPALTAFYMYG